MDYTTTSTSTQQGFVFPTTQQRRPRPRKPTAEHSLGPTVALDCSQYCLLTPFESYVIPATTRNLVRSELYSKSRRWGEPATALVSRCELRTIRDCGQATRGLLRKDTSGTEAPRPFSLPLEHRRDHCGTQL